MSSPVRSVNVWLQNYNHRIEFQQDAHIFECYSLVKVLSWESAALVKLFFPK